MQRRKRIIAEVSSGMHSPSGENMWAYPASDSFSEDLKKSALGLLDIPKEIPGDSSLEQAPHIQEPTDRGVGTFDKVDPTANSADDSENEMDKLTSALASELKSRGYTKYANEICEDIESDSNDPLVTSQKIDRKDLRQVTFTSQTGLPETPENVKAIETELAYLGYLGYNSVDKVGNWDVNCIKAWDTFSDSLESFLRKTLNAENNTTIKAGGSVQSVVSILLSMLQSKNLEKIVYVMQYVRQLDDNAKGVSNFRAANIRDRRLKKIALQDSSIFEYPDSDKEDKELDPADTSEQDFSDTSAPANESSFLTHLKDEPNVVPNQSTMVTPYRNQSEHSGPMATRQKAKPIDSGSKTNSGTTSGWASYIAKGGEAAKNFAALWQSKYPSGYTPDYSSFQQWYKVETGGHKTTLSIADATRKLNEASPASTPAATPDTKAEAPVAGNTSETPAAKVEVKSDEEILSAIEAAIKLMANKEVKITSPGFSPFTSERRQVIRWINRDHQGDYAAAAQHVMDRVANPTKLSLMIAKNDQMMSNKTVSEDGNRPAYSPLYSTIYSALKNDKTDHRQKTRQERRQERQQKRAQ